MRDLGVNEHTVSKFHLLDDTGVNSFDSTAYLEKLYKRKKKKKRSWALARNSTPQLQLALSAQPAQDG
jgi:hypothetical protein